MEEDNTESVSEFWWRAGSDASKGECSATMRPGDFCPQCAQDRLVYDTLFVLVCPRCDYVAEGGAFT